MFSNLPGFNRPFLPVDMGEFRGKPFQKLARMGENDGKNFLAFPSYKACTQMYSCILSSWENEMPLTRLPIPVKRITRAKVCNRHCRTVRER